MKRRLLVSSALPYANGDIHIGHLLEYIQADIWTRFMRMRGHEVWFVCADDAHGTPVMLRARAEGVAPEDLIEKMRLAHIRDFDGFGIAFDNYHSTHSPENRELSERIYKQVRTAGLIAEREVEQLYDPIEKMFLPDRYVQGSCPRCHTAGQYGDSCEACSAAYAPTDLINPLSVVSGAKPELRHSNHFFFTLATKTEFLRAWIDEQEPGPGPGPCLQPAARNKLKEWLDSGLRDWDISRDKPYFGFAIPDAEDKFFYVWLDAPIGYLASFANLCARTGTDFEEFLRPGTATELYHFIGKDILYFHGLFWPAMLEGAGLRTPTRLFVHGFLSVNGEKMSKSRGTFITARRYLDLKLNPELLRYYFASKLGDRIEDIDFSLADFGHRVNADLVGKLANIPSRVAGFLSKRFERRLGPPCEAWINPDFDRLAELYERRRFADVMREVMVLAEQVNQRLEAARPWELATNEGRSDELHAICSGAIQAFRILIGLLEPVVPALAAAAEKFLQAGPRDWATLAAPLPEGHQLGEFHHLIRRVEKNVIAKLIEDDEPALAAEPLISLDEFNKVDLRVGQVLAAEVVADSSKLLKLLINLGPLGERQVFAGLQGQIDPAQLTGRQVVVCVNLQPRKMRFGTSEAMVLAAAGDQLALLAPTSKCKLGAKIS